MNTLFILLYLLVSVSVIYYRPKLKFWSLVMIIYLLAIYSCSWFKINAILFGLSTIITLTIALFFNLSWLRLILITKIFKNAKKVLPKISPTEKLALDAGDSWYEREIFQGNPSFKRLHSLKKFSLNAIEQNFLDHETNTLCSMIDDWQITHCEKDLPIVVWQYIRDHKFFGLVIAQEYGGLGFSAAAHSEIVMKIASRSVSAAVTVMVPNSLGPGELLAHYGTTEQKNHYLPRLAKGIDIPCFALTGPTAGSDATAIPDEGYVCYGEYQQQRVLGIKLKNVDKRYITLAPIATLIGLAFKLFDPDNLLNGIGRTGITCALLPHDHQGLEVGNRLLPLDQVFMNGTVRITDSFIPLDWIIGGQKMAGEGWRMLVDCLSIGRSISLPACGTANALLSTVSTSAYATVREQFKVALSSFEGIQEGLAQMAGISYMMNATRQFTVSAVDNGIKPSVASAISKYHLTENGRKVLNWAMDIHAGRAIMMGPKNYLATAYQGAPVGITVEGANIMTRNLMIFGQGAMRSHPYLRKIYECLNDDQGLKIFDQSLMGYLGYFMQNKVRAIFHAWTGGKFAQGYNSKFNDYYKGISRLAAAFSYLSDLILLNLGGELKRKERISARMGDAMSYLYMGCSSLKYYEDNNKRTDDEIYLTWVLQYCLHHAQQALLITLDNFPNCTMGALIKFLLFPYGQTFKVPSDKLDAKLAAALLANGETRTAFKNMCYIPNDPTDIVGSMEISYQKILATLDLKQKVIAATKKLKLANFEQMVTQALKLEVITKNEAEQLTEAKQYALAAIAVDEFDNYELGPKNAHPTWAKAII